MFKCCMCKMFKDGEPEMKNGLGVFCKDCKDKMKTKTSEGIKGYKMKNDGYCLWCGEKIEDTDLKKESGDNHVCCSCNRHRDWLLRCIRHTNRVIRYVTRVEEKEKPERKAREKIRESREINADQVEEKPLPEQEARLNRIELMLNKLIGKLGDI